MSTKTLTMKRLALALAGSLLTASVAFADAPLSYDFSKIRLRPLVEEQAVQQKIPDEARQKLGKHYDKFIVPLQKRDFAAAKPLVEAAVRDLAACPVLAAEAKTIYARELQTQKEHLQDAIRIYDELIATPGLPSSYISRYLNGKRSLLEKLGKYTEANEVAMRALEQPDLTQEGRDNLKAAIINNLFLMKEYDLGLKLANDLVNNPATTPHVRVTIALTAAYNAERMMNKPDEGYALVMKVENVPLEKKHEWQDLQRGYELAKYYINDKKHGPQFDKALAALKRIYDNPEYDMEVRYRMAQAVINSRINVKDDPNPLATVPPVLDFIRKNKAGLSDKQRFTLLQCCMDVYDKHAADKPEAHRFAERIFNDVKAPYDNRIKALYVLAKGYQKSGDKAAEETIYRKGLPIAKESPQTVIDLLSRIANLHYTENDAAKLIAIYNEAFRFNDSPAMKDLVILKTGEVYAEYEQFEKAVRHYLAHGKKIQAADLCDSWDYKNRPLARKLYLEVLKDEKAPPLDRARAYEHLYDGGELAKRYFKLYRELRKNDVQVMHFLNKMLTSGGYAYNAAYDKQIATYELYAGYVRDRKDIRQGNAYKYTVFAYLYKGDIAKAVAVAKEGASNERVAIKPAERYTLLMLADLLPRKGDQKALETACAEADKRHAGEIPLKDRSAQIDIIGSAANMGRMETLVRALSAFKDSLYVPTPRKRYTVEFSERPVVNVANWDRLAKKPVEATMERHYGGGMDFLETDVATGDRGTGIGTDKAKAKQAHPSFSMVCDVEGIHLRLFRPTDEARDIELGLVNGGLYEGYIAPGENQPYICLLQNVTGRLELYNTAYTTANHTRITEKDTDLHRTQTVYTDEGIYNYIFLSWKAYATVIPENGSTWDFETILWSSAGDDCWNGTESIHGRSTWGQLVFNLPKKARVQILKKLLFDIKPAFESEHKAGWSNKGGILDYWQDKDLGDPAFYEERVKPLVDKLDAYLEDLKKDISDEEVLRLADEALPAWKNLRYTVERLRAEYLEDKLVK